MRKWNGLSEIEGFSQTRRSKSFHSTSRRELNIKYFQVERYIAKDPSTTSFVISGFLNPLLNFSHNLNILLWEYEVLSYIGETEKHNFVSDLIWTKTNVLLKNLHFLQ